VWLASFKQPSAVHGEVGKSATSVGLRAPAGRFDAAKGESLDTSDGSRAVSSSPGRGPWTAGGSGEMPGDAEEGIGIEKLPLVLSLAPCGGAGCCPRPPLPWRWGGRARSRDRGRPVARARCQATLRNEKEQECCRSPCHSHPAEELLAFRL